MAGPTHLYDEQITYWQRSGVDAGGDPAFGSPATVTGRWMDSTALVTDATGQELGSSSSIMLDVDLAESDRVYRGTSTAADPNTAGARKIIGRNVAKRPHGGLTVRRYFLD